MMKYYQELSQMTIGQTKMPTLQAIQSFKRAGVRKVKP